MTKSLDIWKEILHIWVILLLSVNVQSLEEKQDADISDDELSSLIGRYYGEPLSITLSDSRGSKIQKLNFEPNDTQTLGDRVKPEEEEKVEKPALETTVFTTRCTTDQTIKVDPDFIPNISDENTVENGLDGDGQLNEDPNLLNDLGSDGPKNIYKPPSPRGDPDHYVDDVK